jgi:hypothetical protein
MRQRKWVSAHQLNRWADTNDAKARLPELIRRLVHATVEQVYLERVGFPAGEETHRPGYDGVTSTKRGNAWVPVGITFWELGTNKNISSKLDDDYDTRIKDRGTGDFKEVTYISVTPRDYINKKKWVDEKNELGRWGEVRVYDSDDIEQWLENAPGVALWLSTYVSTPPEGLVDLSSHWDNLQDRLIKKLPPSALLVSRQRAIESFKEWLSGSPRILAVHGQSPQEVVDVFTAWVESLPEAEQAIIASRAVIIENAEACRALIDSEQRLILVRAERSEMDEALIAEARRKGHHVLVPVSSIRSQGEELLRLERMDRAELEKVLTEAGLSEQVAYSLAQQSGGSFTVLKRRFSSVPIIKSPNWGEAEEAFELVPLLLAGAWRDNFPADQAIISKITGRPYEDARRIVARWRSEADAPVKWVNGVWEFISPLDAWNFLCIALSSNQLDSFEEAAKDVLGLNDPRLELPPEERWQAAILGKRFDHSSELRQGLARTLALLATRDASVQVADTIPLQSRVNRIVTGILPEKATWQRWASLGGLLPLIAEAAPETFLTAVEFGLRGDHPELAKLFAEEQGTMGQAEHTGLLWALERLAWSPILLPRVSIALARLAEHDPGGQLANRPQSSLRDIFFSWMPHTTAPLEQRIKSLKLLLSRHPTVGWKLLMALLPHGSESIIINPAPEWRFWAEGWNRGVSPKEYWLFVQALIRLATATATHTPEKWIDLIGHLVFLPRDELEQVLEGLECAAKTDLAAYLRRKLWDVLREEVQRFRYHSDANWALPPEVMTRLEAIRDNLQPEDAIELAIPLFKVVFENLGDKSLSWEQKEELRWQQRTDVIRAILKSHGFDGVLQLVRSVQQAWSVGIAFAKATGPEYEASVLPALLCHPDESIAKFASAYAANRIYIAGRDWAENRPLAEWRTDEAVQFIIRMPFDNRTWDFIKRFGEKVETKYWRQTEGVPFDLSPEEIERAGRKLIEVGRPISAIDSLAMVADQKTGPVPSVVLDLLEKALAVPQEEKSRPLEKYHVLMLLEKLQKAPDADETRLARLEWLLLPMIGSHHFLPATLHKMLSRDPDFFIELLTILYRPHHRGDEEESKQTEPGADEYKRFQAERAWKLLHNWRRIPGTKEDGIVDVQELRKWVKSAREKAAAADRKEVCDITLGEVFAYAPSEEDRSWPCIPVREVIEEVESPELENGFAIGIANKRGIFSKTLGEGGQQERALATKYEAYAKECQNNYLRTASVLMRVAVGYINEAKSEDARAEAEK